MKKGKAHPPTYHVNVDRNTTHKVAIRNDLTAPVYCQWLPLLSSCTQLKLASSAMIDRGERMHGTRGTRVN